MPNDDEQTLGDAPNSRDTPLGNSNAPTPRQQPETVLDLNELLEQGHRVERVGRFCIDGSLQAEYDDVLEQVGDLVDEHGKVRSDGDQALAEQGEAELLLGRLSVLREQMAAKMRFVRFRAMSSDDWEAFQKARQTPAGDWKDANAANRDMVAACAVAPPMTIAEVNALAAQLGNSQIVPLYNAALLCNISGGMDVPKSLGFSRGQTRPGSLTS